MHFILVKSTCLGLVWTVYIGDGASSNDQAFSIKMTFAFEGGLSSSELEGGGAYISKNIRDCILWLTFLAIVYLKHLFGPKFNFLLGVVGHLIWRDPFCKWWI